MAPRIADIAELGDIRQFFLTDGKRVLEFEDPDVVEKINDVMDSYAKDGLDIVKRMTDSTLDYAEASLSILETTVASLAKKISIDNELASDEGFIITLCHKLGAYLGQVMRRSVGGEWSLPSRSNGSLELAFENGLRCSPSLQIFFRFSGESKISLNAYVNEIKRRAAIQGQS